MPTYLIPPEENGKRIDVVLTTLLRVTRGRVQAAMKAGLVTREGKILKPHALAFEGETLHYSLPDELPALKKAAPTSIKIVFEDDDVLIVSKPAGLLVHATHEGSAQSTLVDAILVTHPHIQKVGENALRPGIVHRLDKDVSGLMVVAKNQEAFVHLKSQFANRKVKKEYIALAYGPLPQEHGIIDLKIARSKNRGRMVARPEGQPGKEALTEYDVVTRYKTTTLARVHTLTGRTHQIRTHFKGIDHPLVGDQLYKKKHMRHIKPIPLPRIFLHAARLTVPLPNGTIETFEDPLPDDLKKVLATL